MEIDKTNLWRGFSSAWRLLTAIPLPGDAWTDPKRALRWFPVVGIILGAGALATLYLFGDLTQTWPAGAAFIAIAALSLATGSLHLDGLADWADAFWNPRDRERTLAIMKDSRIGAFGVVALVLLLLGKWICLTKLFEAGSGGWLIAALAAGRAAQVALAVRHPYARAEGTGRLFVEGAATEDATIAGCIAIAAALLFAPKLLPALIILAVAYAALRAFGAWCNKRIGGITGDLLGAGGELSEILILLLAASNT